MAKNVFIVSAKRTPIGSFGGVLSSVSATELGAVVIRNLLSGFNFPKNLIDEVYFGNVYSSNLGQAPARQAAIKAGLDNHVCCTTINKVCSSGMKSLMLGAQSIMLGQAQVVVVGGMESMSNVPFYLPKTRWGNKYGNFEVIDGLQKDGLQDAYDNTAMGVSADETARKYGISRNEQDDYTIRSYSLAMKSWNENLFSNEISKVKYLNQKQLEIVVDEDEEFKNVNFDKIPLLKPAFSKEGTVTAANASTINDGAAALLLMSEEKVKEFGLQPLARIVSFADAEQEPKWFTTTPTIAAPKALKMAGLQFGDIDFMEVNEAFAVVTLAFAKVLDLNINKINVRGGAVALGHPLGASGARILVTLTHIMNQSEGSKYGLAAICNGGGGASAVVLEKL
ncbi:MAG: thiolase family protein [Saprospiraceae bacterium]